ncbi:Brix_domain-containing protein [Hexamita inflata]|uniref:Brix domain-containing protein n=1 Tax=Hexamita inflata TaxID=28002 RepID=A0AA86V4V1_9EUKA|nr:Brix domain-containing protein [Hexamita inflata]CAI9956833.1 Brix domain-containing protein [Hexamita inflata]
MNQDQTYSLVYKRGQTSTHVVDLVKSVKQMMEPCTYPNFRMRKTNTIKDIVAISSGLDVAFLLQFTSNGTGTNMQVVRVPHGPSLLFQVHKYTTELQKETMITAPLTILNGFSNSDEDLMMKETFKNMFPSVDMSSQQVIERIIVVNKLESGLIQIRHYRFQNLQGVDQGLLSMIHSKQAKVETIEQILNGTQVDDRVQEIGPRIDISLIRILGGLMRGEMLFHKYKDFKEAQQNKELEQKAKRTQKIQKKQEIEELRKRQYLAKKKAELEKRKDDQKLIREQKQVINGEMVAEQEGFTQLVGEIGRGREKDYEKDKEQEQEELKLARDKEREHAKRGGKDSAKGKDFPKKEEKGKDFKSDKKGKDFKSKSRPRTSFEKNRSKSGKK